MVVLSLNEILTLKILLVFSGADLVSVWGCSLPVTLLGLPSHSSAFLLSHAKGKL